jgi:copper chaperone for superoxide dismutase
VEPNQCSIDVSVSGIESGSHGLVINQYGNIEKGWKTTGDLYGDDMMNNGSSLNSTIGLLGNIDVGIQGTGNLLINAHPLSISNIIGRSVVLYEKPIDELFVSSPHCYTLAHHFGEGLLAGVIAKSAGIFENRKRVCSCSGQTIWQEILPMNT